MHSRKEELTILNKLCQSVLTSTPATLPWLLLLLPPCQRLRQPPRPLRPPRPAPVRPPRYVFFFFIHHSVRCADRKCLPSLSSSLLRVPSLFRVAWSPSRHSLLDSSLEQITLLYW